MSGEIDVMAEGGATPESEFPEGDPRRPPFELTERARAVGDAVDERRWHQRSGADWLAMRLQYGRGRSVADVAAMFAVSDSSIYPRIRNEKWLQPMSERDRRNMARRVWIGGLARFDECEKENRAALKASSEWRLIVCREPEPLWQSSDAAGHKIKVQDIHNDDGFFEADPKHEQREHISRRLDQLIAQLESEEGKTADNSEGAPALVADARGAEQSGAGE